MKCHRLLKPLFKNSGELVSSRVSSVFFGQIMNIMHSDSKQHIRFNSKSVAQFNETPLSSPNLFLKIYHSQE